MKGPGFDLGQARGAIVVTPTVVVSRCLGAPEPIAASVCLGRCGQSIFLVSRVFLLPMMY